MPAEELIKKHEVSQLLPYFNTFEAAITTAGFLMKVMDNKAYVYLMRSLGYMGEYPDSFYDEDKEINKQLFDFESSLQVEKDYLKWNEHYVKTMSVQSFPEDCCLSVMDQLIGDPKVPQIKSMILTLYQGLFIILIKRKRLQLLISAIKH